MSNILFICKSNVGRSQMAEAFFANTGTAHVASSAGIYVKEENENQPISKKTEKVTVCMQEVGIDVSTKRMKQLTAEMVERADMIISIAPESTLPDYLQNSPKLETWDIPDAGGTDLDFHRQVRDRVREKVEDLVLRLSK